MLVYNMQFAAETFLFAYIGLSAVTFRYDNAVPLALGALALCVIGRALNIFPLSLIVNQFRSKRISLKVQLVLWFSGLRGIISFALALNVPGSDHDVLAAATLIVVMLTIIFFGGGESGDGKGKEEGALKGAGVGGGGGVLGSSVVRRW